MLILIISFLSLSGVEASATTNFLTYQNPIQGIKMQYPSDWRVSQNGLRDFSDIVGFYAPFGNLSDLFPARLIVSVKHYSENMTLDGYSNFVNNSLKQPNVQVIKSSPSILAGNPAHEVVLVASPGVVPFKIATILVWTLKDNNVYTISFNSDQGKFLTYLPTVQKMINTFELTNSTGIK